MCWKDQRSQHIHWRFKVVSVAAGGTLSLKAGDPGHMGLKHASRKKNVYDKFFDSRAQKCI